MLRGNIPKRVSGEKSERGAGEHSLKRSRGAGNFPKGLEKRSKEGPLGENEATQQQNLCWVQRKGKKSRGDELWRKVFES